MVHYKNNIEIFNIYELNVEKIIHTYFRNKTYIYKNVHVH